MTPEDDFEKTKRARVAFCVSRCGRIFRAAVESANDLGIEVTLLIAEQRADPSLDDFCKAQAVRIVRLPMEPREVIDDLLSASLLASHVDLICLTFDKLVPANVVAKYEHRMLNLHMGLLPGTEGLHPIRQSLASGTRFSGATLHEVTNETDTGPIVAQCVVGVLPDDTPESLGARIYPLARDLMLRAIGWYAAGRMRHDAAKVLIDDAIYGVPPSSPIDQSVAPKLRTLN
jgi:folate-dependent phosphoribosylglycinamide formyltransferase PurN